MLCLTPIYEFICYEFIFSLSTSYFLHIYINRSNFVLRKLSLRNEIYLDKCINIEEADAVYFKL